MVETLKFRNGQLISYCIYNGCNYLSVLVLKLIYVNEKGPC